MSNHAMTEFTEYPAHYHDGTDGTPRENPAPILAWGLWRKPFYDFVGHDGYSGGSAHPVRPQVDNKRH